MFGNIDPKKIASMMSKMGINQEEVPAEKVIIEQENKNIIIENPQIVRIKMQGQISFQITGDISEKEKINEEDIKQIMDKCSVTKEEAEKALKENNNDLAEAILSLS